MVNMQDRLKERREEFIEEKEKAYPACNGENRSMACLERPQVTDQVTDGQWSLFLYEWGLYKEECDMSSEYALYQLLGCVSHDSKQKVFDVTNGKV